MIFIVVFVEGIEIPGISFIYNLDKVEKHFLIGSQENDELEKVIYSNLAPMILLIP